MGSMQFQNIIQGGFEGDLYPVHPKLDMIQGYKAYKSVLDIPKIPDLAFIILPPKVIPEVMEQCGQKGIKYLIITSGGFREIGPEGKKLSLQIDEIAKNYGMRFIGPNCLGIYNGWYGSPKEDIHLNTMWITETTGRGNVSIASQSGTIACHTVWQAKRIGLKIGKSISNGNENNIDLVDMLEYFKNDPQTEVIGLYIEEVKRGKEFINIARQITPEKPIIAIYAGGSEAATRTINSHTGSIGGNQKIFDAVFKKTGIISTDSINDFLYYLRTFSWTQKTGFYPKGNRVGIITNSGGAGAMMIKNLEAYGLTVPEFSVNLQEKIHLDISKTASASNPIDVTFDTEFANLYIKFPKLLVESGEVDSIIVYGIFDFGEIMKFIDDLGYLKGSHLKNINSMIDSMMIKPLTRLIQRLKVPIFYLGPQPYEKFINQKFLSRELPIFDFWDEPTKCLSVITRYAEFREKVIN